MTASAGLSHSPPTHPHGSHEAYPHSAAQGAAGRRLLLRPAVLLLRLKCVACRRRPAQTNPRSKNLLRIAVLPSRSWFSLSLGPWNRDSGGRRRSALRLSGPRRGAVLRAIMSRSRHRRALPSAVARYSSVVQRQTSGQASAPRWGTARAGVVCFVLIGRPRFFSVTTASLTPLPARPTSARII
jgi:hypothetical protein